jgi:hypothetical protein
MKIATKAKISESGVQGIMRTLPNWAGLAARHDAKANKATAAPKTIRVVVKSTQVLLSALHNHDPFCPKSTA